MAFKECTNEEMIEAYEEAVAKNPGMTSVNLLVRIAADTCGARPSDIRAAIDDEDED